jgi:ubiquinone/menaquinone biosynthesis C-methylase UbiE
VPNLKSNIEWKLWGKDDPLYGVASWSNKQKGAESEWTEEDFYALGESDWQDFVQRWQQYGLNKESCLEVGCGAGRITRQLVLFFNHVHAVDVSEAMIGYARNRIEAGNVQYSVVDGLSLPQKDLSVKAIFSAHVLQHLDNIDIGLSQFSEFFRVLDFGGTLMVHMPLYQWPRETGKLALVFKEMYRFQNKVDDAKAYLARRRGIKTMRGTRYPLPLLHSKLQDTGFKNIEFRIFPTLSNGALHPFVFCTK